MVVLFFLPKNFIGIPPWRVSSRGIFAMPNAVKPATGLCIRFAEFLDICRIIIHSTGTNGSDFVITFEDIQFFFRIRGMTNGHAHFSRFLSTVSGNRIIGHSIDSLEKMWVSLEHNLESNQCPLYLFLFRFPSHKTVETKGKSIALPVYVDEPFVRSSCTV